MLIFCLIGIWKVFASPHGSTSEIEPSALTASKQEQLRASYLSLERQRVSLEKAKAGQHFDQVMYQIYASLSRLLLKDASRTIPRDALLGHEVRLRALGREIAESLYIYDIWVLLTDTSQDPQSEPFLKFFLESGRTASHRDYGRMVQLERHLSVVLGSSNDSDRTLFCTESAVTEEPEWSRPKDSIETEKAVLDDWFDLLNTEDWMSALSKIEHAYQLLVNYDLCEGKDAQSYLLALYACWSQGQREFVEQLSMQGIMERFDHYFLMYKDDALKQRYIDLLARGQRGVVDLTLRVHMLRRMLVLSQEMSLEKIKSINLTEAWFDGVCDLALLSLDEAQRAECVIFFSYFLMEYFQSHTLFSAGHRELIGKVTRVAKRMKPSLLQVRFIEDIKNLLGAATAESEEHEAGRLAALEELEELSTKVKHKVVLLPTLKRETPIVRNRSKHEDLLSLALPDSELSLKLSSLKR